MIKKATLALFGLISCVGDHRAAESERTSGVRDWHWPRVCVCALPKLLLRAGLLHAELLWIGYVAPYYYGGY